MARDFSCRTTHKFIRKVSAGYSALPLVCMEAPQKCEKGVHLTDLATWKGAGPLARKD
ncbi:pyocin activator PrtN family protein [Oricola indica]|uniref:pyocin activator PrtN family protein n=1 Tax=Oricola indica TaxID=2872591 RepID=UPI001CBC594B|nr:pyocin activator PrtN family protein [Oricola indica]